MFLNIRIPDKETRNKIRKELKRIAGNEDKKIWQILVKLLNIK